MQDRNGPGRARGWCSRASCLVLLLGAAAGAHAAAVYRCDHGSGPPVFRDTPCPGARQQARLDVAGQPLIDPAAPRPRAINVPRPHPPSHTSHHRRRRHRARETQPMSWECRAADGEVFYRHARCPGSIRGDGIVRGTPAPTRLRRRHTAWDRIRVHGSRIPRAEACRRIHSAGAAVRDGHLRDDHVSTYDHLMGRDPCGSP